MTCSNPRTRHSKSRTVACEHVQNVSVACRRDTAVETAAKYVTMFGDDDGTVPATYQVPLTSGPLSGSTLCPAADS